MGAAVASTIITGLMRTLLPKLGSLLENKDKLSKGAKKKIASLEEEMSSMNALLVKLSGIEELDVQDKDWRDKVHELSYNMEDCIDLFMDNLSRAGAKSGLVSGLRKIQARYKVAKLIEELKDRAAQVSSCHERYKVGVCLSQPAQPARPPVVLVEEFYADPASLVGIDGQRESIIELLMEGQQVQQQPGVDLARWTEEKPCCSLQDSTRATTKSIPASNVIKFISIVGFGGAGKTTLAAQVYAKIKTKFDCAAFVSVTQNPDRVKIWSHILLEVTQWDCVPSGYANQCQRICGLLREHLEDQRFLVVLDDVWTLDALKTIKWAFVENNRGSRVIITTRNEDVAKAYRTFGFHGHVCKIKPLNDMDSRKLFQRRIFHSEDACPEQLKNVSEGILKKCGGVPLVILCVASILSNHKEDMREETWEKIKAYLSFEFERNHHVEQMRRVLNLGYIDLSPDLQTCMLYLAVYPEDCEIMKDDLKRRWIAEGLVGDGPEEAVAAESYFNQLVNRSMIQIAELDDCGDVVSCRVHDLMLDFIISKSKDENFMTIINSQRRKKGALEVRRLSLHVRNSECNQVVRTMDLVQARSFNFWGPARLMPSLSAFRLLRVLYLDVYEIDSDAKPYNLSSIGKFFQLKYLRIRGIKELDVGKLPSSLLHLIVPYTVKSFGEITRMSALHTLAEFRIDLKDVKSTKGLGDLSKLTELKLVLCNDLRLEDATEGACDDLVSSLCRLQSLGSLAIRMRGSLDIVNVLTCWSPPPRHIRRLHVLGLPFSTVSDWVTSLVHLRSLRIQVVSLPRDGAKVLARLTSLVHLTLHVRKNASEEGGIVIHTASFPDLKDFVFRNEVPCLVFQAGAMRKIQSLTVECYAEAKRQGSDLLDGIEHLGSLNSFKVDIYKKEDFTRIQYELQSADDCPHEEEPKTWDVDSLKAALTKAINKHPGFPHIRIQPV